MENYLKRTEIAFNNDCGPDRRLSLCGGVRKIMDAASLHAEVLGVGAAAFEEQHRFWLAVRTRLRFYRRPQLMEEFTVTTWPTPPARLYCKRHYRFEKGEEILADAWNEWAILDLAAGRPVRTTDVYPAGLALREEGLLPEPTERFADDFTAEEMVAMVTPQSSDIDYGQHVNNIAYLRMLTDTFSVEELGALNLQDFDIAYLRQCYEGETLSIYRRREGEGYRFLIRKQNGEPAFFAMAKP